jgi:predicted negative regulator of RcsB-dependent stress response
VINMVEVYDAHEQGEVVKKWLTENGSAIVMGLVIAFGGLFGFKQWQAWQVNSRQEASAEYAVLGEYLAAEQLDAAMANFQKLKEEYPDSAYTSMAALQMARARLDASQPDLAVTELRYVMNNGYPKALQMVARERLARVLLDMGDADGALATLDGAQDISGFEARFAEVRGDIYFVQGRMAEAETAYRQAMGLLEVDVGDRERLRMKLESMGADLSGDGNAT